MKKVIVTFFKSLKGGFRLGFEKAMAKRRLKDQMIFPTNLTFELEGEDEDITVQIIVSDDWILSSGLSIPPEIPGCGINLEGKIIANEAFMEETEEFRFMCILHELEHITREHYKNMDNVAKPSGRIGKSYIEADLEVDREVAKKVGKETYIKWLKYYSTKMDNFMTSEYAFPENKIFRQRIEALEIN